MRIDSSSLIADLEHRTRMHKAYAEEFHRLSLGELSMRYGENSWNILECLEHLNLYGDFYIPEIRRRMEAKKTAPETHFKSGFLGHRFAVSMLPSDKMKTIKTIKSKNPIGRPLDKNCINRFLQQQEAILHLLDDAKGVSLNKIKTNTSISSLVKLKLGDTFKVLVFHNERHIAQALNVYRTLKDE